jgi:hypothetical protein
MITKENIKAYLQFLVANGSITMDNQVIEKWGTLTDEKLQSTLQKMYTQANWSTEKINQLENSFLQSITNIGTIEEVTIINEVPNPPRFVDNTPPSAPTYVAPPLQPRPTNPVNTTTNMPSYVAPKKRGGGILLLLLAITILSLLFAAYKYKVYKSLGDVYVLTNNVALRGEDNEQGKPFDRMDLFGDYMDDQGQVHTSYAQAKVIANDLDNRFIQVQLSPSFTNFMFGTSDPVFVHRNMVTFDKKEQEKFQTVFYALRSDYNELDKLQIVYRKIICNAIAANPELSGLTVAAPCNIAAKINKDAPLSIGQYTSKDINNNIEKRYAVVQLSDGFYYTIAANKEGIVEHLYKTMIESAGELVSMNFQGKFKYEDPYKFTYGDLVWTSCDGNYKRKAVEKPFNVFR